MSVISGVSVITCFKYHSIFFADVPLFIYLQRTWKTKKIYSFMHKLNNFFLILIYLFSFNFFYNFEHIFYSCFYTTKQEENNTNFLIFYLFLIIQFEKKNHLYIFYSFSFLIFLFLHFFFP